MIASVCNEKPHDDKPILIPDGQYTLAYLEHKTWLFKGKHPKLTVTFAIQDFGEFYLSHINAYYNLLRIKGKPSRNGHFIVGWKSDFMLDYSILFGTPVRKDRISMFKLRNIFVKATTRTVIKNRDQREYPEGLRYSVVDRLERAMEI